MFPASIPTKTLAGLRAFKFPQPQCEALQTLITSLLSQHHWQQSGRASQALQLPEQLEARWLTFKLKARWLKLEPQVVQTVP